ncbi:hypothetical protein IWQ60_002792 [Tieghemiomyces parasiticus]|uniref:Uncharacterized protein n=1 Tax=Tieghemiomyces parasiticus TaxID=78921 RepID=A0A9W8AEG3_9FUNG|nr:hypothetical protein IWQ60_002792 [Tieghemiomyces parasiticus]
MSRIRKTVRAKFLESEMYTDLIQQRIDQALALVEGQDSYEASPTVPSVLGHSRSDSTHRPPQANDTLENGHAAATNGASKPVPLRPAQILQSLLQSSPSGNTPGTTVADHTGSRNSHAPLVYHARVGHTVAVFLPPTNLTDPSTGAIAVTGHPDPRNDRCLLMTVAALQKDEPRFTVRRIGGPGQTWDVVSTRVVPLNAREAFAVRDTVFSVARDSDDSDDFSTDLQRGRVARVFPRFARVKFPGGKLCNVPVGRLFKETRVQRPKTQPPTETPMGPKVPEAPAVSDTRNTSATHTTNDQPEAPPTSFRIVGPMAVPGVVEEAADAPQEAIGPLNSSETTATLPAAPVEQRVCITPTENYKAELEETVQPPEAVQPATAETVDEICLPTSAAIAVPENTVLDPISESGLQNGFEAPNLETHGAPREADYVDSDDDLTSLSSLASDMFDGY